MIWVLKIAICNNKSKSAVDIHQVHPGLHCHKHSGKHMYCIKIHLSICLVIWVSSDNTGVVAHSTQQIVMGQWWEWQWHEQPCYLTVAHWLWHVTTQKERTWCVSWTSSVKLDCGTVFWLVCSMACMLSSFPMLSWKLTLPHGCRWSPSTEVCADLYKHQAFWLSHISTFA